MVSHSLLRQVTNNLKCSRATGAAIQRINGSGKATHCKAQRPAGERSDVGRGMSQGSEAMWDVTGERSDMGHHGGEKRYKAGLVSHAAGETLSAGDGVGPHSPQPALGLGWAHSDFCCCLQCKCVETPSPAPREGL